MIKKTSTKTREKAIPERKLKTVSELENLIKISKTVLICSIKGLPGKQFQNIKKKIREHAKIKIVKKSIALRAIENTGVKHLAEHVKEDSALLFSDLDAFELSGILSENKNPVAARVGQIAAEDVEIEPWPWGNSRAWRAAPASWTACRVRMGTLCQISREMG